MSAVTSVVFIAAVAASASVASAAPQVEPLTVYAGEERAVYATVVDQKGTPVTTLRTEDFVVREGGVEREVLRAAPAAEPMRIAVLVDTSQAMQRYVHDLRSGLRAFFRQIPAEHEIALFEFGDRPTRLVDYTRDHERVTAGIGRLFARSGSGSYVLDAITDVSREFRARETARPVIVVITAEGPEFSQRYHRTVLDDVQAAHATLHSFVITRRRPLFFNDGVRERDITLSKGADLTGGRREDLITSMALEERLTELATELRAQYQIVYARPKVLVPATKMNVMVRSPGLTVRASRVPLKASAF
jgi:VWFA-related protein